MKRSFMVLLFLLFTTTSLQAAPLTWNLVDVTFNDGAIATGSFVFDADTSNVLDWNMYVSGGNESTFPVFSYTPLTAPDVGVSDVNLGKSLYFFVDGTALGGTPESRVLVLTSIEPMTNSGGTVTLLTNDVWWESRECYNCNPYRLVVSGSLTAVPVPATFWLFGSGAVGLIGIARRKKS